MDPFPGFPSGQWLKASRPRRSKAITFSLPPEMEARARRVMRVDDLSKSELLRQVILAYRFRRNLKLNALDFVKSGGSERTGLPDSAHSPPSQISKMVLSTVYVGGLEGTVLSLSHKSAPLDMDCAGRDGFPRKRE